MADRISLNWTGTSEKHCDRELEIMKHVFLNGMVRQRVDRADRLGTIRLTHREKPWLLEVEHFILGMLVAEHVLLGTQRGDSRCIDEVCQNTRCQLATVWAEANEFFNQDVAYSPHCSTIAHH